MTLFHPLHLASALQSHTFDRSPHRPHLLTSWTKQSLGSPLSLTRTRTTVLPFQCDDDQFPLPIHPCTPFQLTPKPQPKKVDEHKLSQYTQGSQRKSKREKEKEEAERKRREEEEHAKKAYAEFLETFEGSRDDGKKKGFVRSTQESGGAEYTHSRSETSSRAAPRVGGFTTRVSAYLEASE